MNQTELFDPADTVPAACPAGHCQAIRTAGQTGPIATCAHDLDPDRRRRPRGCLNTYDPSTAPLPEGF